MRGPIWFSVNNQASHEDLPDLRAFGITARPRHSRPVTVYRDPVSERMIAEIGTVNVWRDGRVRFRPRHDCPDSGINVLVRTALECVERDLHLRDKWTYFRATRDVPVGQWSATICVGLRDSISVFEAHTAMLQPASSPARAERVPDDEQQRTHQNQ